MTETATTMDVRRAGAAASVIDIKGDITAASEDVLMDAYRSAADGVRVVILSFADLEYMNSGGIGLLVTLLVRAKRNRHRLLAFGLTEHYREIFEITRLADFMTIVADEATAVEADAGMTPDHSDRGK